MRRGGRRERRERRGGRQGWNRQGGKQRVLVAPRGEGPEQLTSVHVCVFSTGLGVNGSVRVRLAELVLLPP